MPRDAFRLAFRANMSAESDTGELMLYGEITKNLNNGTKKITRMTRAPSTLTRQ